MEHPIITEPFEVIAIDIVGPLPKDKSGENIISLASRWPGAVPLRTMMATEVEKCLVSIFC